MSEPHDKQPGRRPLPAAVAEKQQRRLRARHQPEQTIWFGLGMFGLIGWSIAIPALIGVAIGLWIDHRWPTGYSWTLMLMLAGVGIGCANAWKWVHRESEWDKPVGTQIAPGSRKTSQKEES